MAKNRKDKPEPIPVLSLDSADPIVGRGTWGNSGKTGPGSTNWRITAPAIQPVAHSQASIAGPATIQTPELDSAVGNDAETGRGVRAGQEDNTSIINYAGRRIIGGALGGTARAANMFTALALSGAPQSELDTENLKYDPTKRKAIDETYREYLGSLSQDEKDAMTVTGTMPTPEQIYAQKLYREDLARQKKSAPPKPEFTRSDARKKYNEILGRNIAAAAADPDAVTPEMVAELNAAEKAIKQTPSYEEPTYKGDQFEIKKWYNWDNPYRQETEERYKGAENGKGTKFIGDLADVLGNMTPAMALNTVPGIGQWLSYAYLFGSAGGGAMYEALENGATNEEALRYGAAVGATEIATEKLFDGVAGMLGKGMADDVVESVVEKVAKSSGGNKFLQNLTRWGINTAGESAEEVISGLTNPLLQTIYNNKTVQESYDDLNWEDLGEQILMGLAAGGLLSSVGFVNGDYKTKNQAIETKIANEVLADFYNTPEGRAWQANATAAETDSNPLAQAILNNGNEDTPLPQTGQEGVLNAPQNDTGAPLSPVAEAVLQNERANQENIALNPVENGDTMDGTLRRAVEMQREGYTPSQIYNETGLFSLSNGRFRNGATGEIFDPGAVQNDQGGNATNNSGGFSEIGRASGEIGRIGESDKRLLRPERSWGDLTEQERSSAADVIARFSDNSPDSELSMLKAAYEKAGVDASTEIARRIYEDYAVSPVVAENRWGGLFADIDGLLAEMSGSPGFRAPIFPETARSQAEANSIPETTGTTVNPVRLAPEGSDASRLSAGVETVRNAPVTTPEFAALIDKTVSEGGYRYIPITNNETVQRATARIERDGWDKARSDWTADVRAGKTSADMMATGALLYNNAVNAGDTKAAADIMADYIASGTNAAQALQARQIIQSMGPDGQLYMIQKKVDELSDKLLKKVPDGIKISDELKDEYRRAATDAERDAIIEQMQAEVAEQIPASLKDKWTALRYVNMLGNFRTQARNILGNTSMAVTTTAKNAVQTLVEGMAYIGSGGKYQRTTSLFASPELVKEAMADYRANSDYINGEQKYSDMQSSDAFMRGVDEKRKIFSFAPLEGYRKVTNWAMTRGDTMFIGPRYARTLAGYLQANGMDAATFAGIRDGSIQPTAAQNAMLEKARNYAAKEAQEATFHDNNALSSWVSKIGRKPGTPNAVKVISEGVLPFRKTPANVLIRAEEYSPLGLVNATVKAVQAAKGINNVTASDVINSLSKSLTGTGIFLAGMALRNAGWLTGEEEDEKQAGFNSLRGGQQYAINLPDGTSITLDWLAPTSVPLFMGAQLQDAIMNGGFTVEKLGDTLSGITNPMIQMSMLQGVDDTLGNIKYSDNNLVQVAMSAAMSYFSQGLTNTMMGQLERTVEGKRTTTFTDAETRLGRNLQKAVGKAMEKVPIPGADYKQIDYIDAWGREAPAEENAFARAFNNFVNPGYVSHDNSTEVDNELQRLYDAGAGNVFPQRLSATDKFSVYDEHGQRSGERRLTADEYVAVQKDMGQTSLRLVKDLIGTAMYDGMSDDAKADAIANIYQYAKHQALREVEPSMEDKYSAVAALSNPSAYFAVKSAYSDAASNQWNRDYDEIDSIMDSWSTVAPDVQKALFENNSQMEKVYNAYKKGTTPETWFTAYDATKALTPYGDNKDVADWQKYEAIANAAPKDADAILEGYMPEGTYRRYKAARDAGCSAQVWAKANAECNQLTPYGDNKGVVAWQKHETVLKNAKTNREADALMAGIMDADLYDRYTVGRDMGVSPKTFVEAHKVFSMNNRRKGDTQQWLLSQGYNKAQANYIYELLSGKKSELSGLNDKYRG